MKKSWQPTSKSMNLYRRLILLIFSGLFVIFTLTFVLIYSLGNSDTSTWIGKIQQFLLNLYPNILIIPFTILCSYLFFRPISNADQEEQEEQFLEKMKNTFLPALEEKIIENTKDLLTLMVRTTLTHVLQDSASIQEMGIIAVKPHINYGELRDRIAQSKDRVYLSDTWIFYNFNGLEDAFKQTAVRQIPLRILLLDPNSPVSKQRAIDLKGPLDPATNPTTAMSIRTFYQQFSLDNLELRFHSTMPAMQIFMCDNKAMVGFYFHGQDSQTLPQLEVLIKDEKGEYTIFGRLIEAEFETKWSLATPAPSQTLSITT